MAITKQQAIQLYESNWWEGRSARDVAMFQLFEDYLCLPFDKFQAAVEQALGRPVWTHEFGLNRDGLQKELLGERPAPTFEDIVALIPEQQRVIIVAS